MKKYLLYGLGIVMGLALTACDGYKEPNPPAQSNPQESILKASEVTAQSAVSSEVYNLKTMIADKENILLAKINCEVLPEGYDFGAIAFVTIDDFESAYPVATAVVPSGLPDEWNVEIIADSLQVAYNDNISTEEEETSLKVRFLATTICGEQVAIVGGLNHFYGPYSITILPDEPAQLEMSGPFLYTPGGSNGWNQESSQKLFTIDGGVNYMGFALIQDEFKFTDVPGWDGTNYGAGDTEDTLSTDGGAGNLKVDVNGLYWCTVNTSDLTYSLTLISNCGVIGDFNGWAEQAALSTTNDLVWSGDIEFTSTGGFKFRFNDNWDINLGGDSFKYLLPGGANLNIPGEGVYTVILDLSRLPYSCKLVAK